MPYCRVNKGRILPEIIGHSYIPHPFESCHEFLYIYIGHGQSHQPYIRYAEEVSVETSHSNHIVAILNDESNEVGSVHLGIVHYWALDAPKVTRQEQMITQMSFMDPGELQAVKDTLETWSALCVDHLAEIEQRRESALSVEAFSKDT